MKTNLRLVLTVTLFSGLLARPALADKPPGTNALGVVVAEAPAAIAPAPAPAKTTKATKAKTSSHKTAAKKAVVKKAPANIPNISVPLKPGAATVSAKRVNVRGQATTRCEVIGRLTNSQPVTVIEEIVRSNAKEDEPSVWAKISLPEGIHLWVSSQFVDATNKTVKVKKLNLRTGPGENYSVAGTLLKGDAVKDISATNGWLEVEAPANSFAYIAAAYLKQQDATAPEQPAVAAGTVIPPSPVTPVEPAPVVPTSTTTVADNPIVAAPPTDTPVTPVPPVTNPDVGVVKPAPVAKPVVSKEPPVPRIVEREGVVRRTFSIQAPSTFALVNSDTGKTVNYLYTNAKNLDLARYKGLRIIVTGEEGLDERWKNTPIITIQKIQVVE
ncbi:MAG: SH3 domain-containing protein [Verrucomicrobia bacterium]|nr:SH3 domain-containing protein [Verrucomicrobiota bacterium]